MIPCRALSAAFTRIPTISAGFSHRNLIERSSAYLSLLCFFPWKPGFELVGMMMHCLNWSVLWLMIPLCAAKGAVVVGSELGFLKACTANGLVGDVGKPHKGFLTPDHSWMKCMFFLFVALVNISLLWCIFTPCTAMCTPQVHMTCFWNVLVVFGHTMFTWFYKEKL